MCWRGGSEVVRWEGVRLCVGRRGSEVCVLGGEGVRLCVGRGGSEVVCWEGRE